MDYKILDQQTTNIIQFIGLQTPTQLYNKKPKS